MALSDCSCQVVWMHTLMGELGYHLKHVLICGDNQGSIFITSNPVTEKRSKHIDIHYHYIREVVERKFAEIFFINGYKNPADLLTKNLGSVKFQFSDQNMVSTLMPMCTTIRFNRCCLAWGSVELEQCPTDCVKQIPVTDGNRS